MHNNLLHCDSRNFAIIKSIEQIHDIQDPFLSTEIKISQISSRRKIKAESSAGGIVETGFAHVSQSTRKNRGDNVVRVRVDRADAISDTSRNHGGTTLRTRRIPGVEGTPRLVNLDRVSRIERRCLPPPAEETSAFRGTLGKSWFIISSYGDWLIYSSSGDA